MEQIYLPIKTAYRRNLRIAQLFVYKISSDPPGTERSQPHHPTAS